MLSLGLLLENVEISLWLAQWFELRLSHLPASVFTFDLSSEESALPSGWFHCSPPRG